MVMKRNWRLFALVTLLVFVAGIVLGCGSSAPAGGDKPQGTQLITIGTATVGGAWYPMGGALANVISAYVPGAKASATPTGATIENLAAMKAKKMEIGFCTVDIPYQVYRGLEGKEKDENLRALVMNDEIYLCIITKKDSPINNFMDLKGKKMGTGVAGSAAYFIVEEVLKAHGMTYNDVKPYQAGNNQQAQALKDGNIDAFCMTTAGRGGAAPALVELATTCDIKFIPLSDEVLKKINQAKPYYTIREIPKGWVKGVDQPVKALGIGTVIAIRKDLPDDLVYNITKAIFEHKKELDAIHPQWQQTTKETAAKDVPIPLHPGAEKYYKENGFPINILP